MHSCVCSRCRYRVYGICECLRVLDKRRQELFARHIDHSARLDIDSLGVGFILNLRAGFKFRLCKHSKPLEQADRLICHHSRDRFHHGADVRKPSSLSFLNPCLRITVSVEYDLLVLYRILFDQIMHSQIKVVRLLQHIARIRERLGNDRVQHDIRRCHRIAGADHAELKFVSGKRER